MAMEFCDLLCVHARLPQEEAIDGSGSCRTFVGLYCTLKKSFVHKNLPCKHKSYRDVKRKVEKSKKKHKS